MPNSSKLQLPDIAELSKGIPLQQIVQGDKPEVIVAGAGAQAALPAGEQDVVIQDLDTDKPINLDDIPF